MHPKRLKPESIYRLTSVHPNVPHPNTGAFAGGCTMMRAPAGTFSNVLLGVIDHAPGDKIYLSE